MPQADGGPVRWALSFLTRLPGGRHAASAAELAAAVAWFPLIGAFVGALGAAGQALTLEVAPPVVAAAAALAVTAAATGALHEDGLADTVDGLAGGRDPEDRRRILDDSRLGTFGVLALVLVTVAKVGALSAADGRVAVAALVTAHCLARTGTVVLLRIAPVAPGSGSGSALAQAVTGGRVVAGVVAGLLITTAGCALAASAPGVDGSEAAVAGVAATAGVAVSALAVASWARQRIGGITGDVLGAAEQLGELVVLVALTRL